MYLHTQVTKCNRNSITNFRLLRVKEVTEEAPGTTSDVD